MELLLKQNMGILKYVKHFGLHNLERSGISGKHLMHSFDNLQGLQSFGYFAYS